MIDDLQAILLANAKNHPGRLAVDGGKLGQLTYGELFGAAAHRAETLVGFRSVGILSNRRPETYCAVLACFLAGVAFTPLNPKFPSARLAKIADLSEVDFVYCDSSTVGAATEMDISFEELPAPPELASGSTKLPVARETVAAETVYRMFTSGSTGEPKGVPIPYGALDHYVRAIRELISFPEASRFSQLFDLSFDLSMHDIFVALANGSTIVPASDLNLMMPHSYVAKQRIDVWFSVPMLAMVAARGLADKIPEHRLQLGLFCGEALPIDYVSRFRALMEDGAPVWNLYGPTEATIAFTARQVPRGNVNWRMAPLGEPFGANRIALLDDQSAVRPVTEGSAGELLLGGPQVFRGYVPHRMDPFCRIGDDVFYRSGDIVRFHEGELHFTGRADGQVKIRGMRIELPEIESAFRNVLGCDTAAAVVHGDQDCAEIRVAYTRLEKLDSIRALAEVLPEYMLPARIWHLPELPVNQNGKVDRKTLGSMEWPTEP